MSSEPIVDPDFGTLEWDKFLHVWRGHSTMATGTPFEIIIHTLSYLTQMPPFEDAKWDRMIAPASRETLTQVRNSDSIIRASIATDLMPRYSIWNNGASIESKKIMQRLELESVTFLPNGDAEVAYGDDGMFGGHALIADLDANGEVNRDELFG
jgi:hypothetical protein